MAVIDGNSYDIYDFIVDGNPDNDVRLNRETHETLANTSRTVVSQRKKRFEFAVRNLTQAERDTLVASLNKSNFVIDFSPFDSTYTVKTISVSAWRYFSGAPNRFNNDKIIVEVL